MSVFKKLVGPADEPFFYQDLPARRTTPARHDVRIREADVVLLAMLET